MARIIDVQMSGDDAAECFVAGRTWAQMVYDQTPSDHRVGEFPLTEEQAAGIPLSFRRDEHEAAVATHQVYEAARGRWAELVTVSPTTE